MICVFDTHTILVLDNTIMDYISGPGFGHELHESKLASSTPQKNQNHPKSYSICHQIS